MSKTRVENIYVLDRPGLDAVIDDIQHGRENWLVVAPVPGENSCYGLVGHGNTGFDGLLECMKSHPLSYALYGTSSVSRTEGHIKFVLISYASDSLPMIRKASVSQHFGSIKTLFGYTHLEYQANDLSDIDVDDIIYKLSISGGAFYDDTGRVSSAVSKIVAENEQREREEQQAQVAAAATTVSTDPVAPVAEAQAEPAVAIAPEEPLDETPADPAEPEE